MNPIKKWAIIIPATIYNVKFESPLMVEFLSKLKIRLQLISYKCYQ